LCDVFAGGRRRVTVAGVKCLTRRRVRCPIRLVEGVSMTTAERLSAGYVEALERVAAETGGRVIGPREVELPAGYGLELVGGDEPEACEPCAGCSGCDECAPGCASEALEDTGGYVRLEESVPAEWSDTLRGPAARRRDLEARQFEARARYVAPGDLEPWRGVLGFTDEELDAYAVRSLPGASPALAAYIGRLSDGPTVSWAWFCAWSAVTGAPFRFLEPDRADPSLWNSRKLPAQIARRVERMRRDRSVRGDGS
jgi:hypothetical protein